MSSTASASRHRRYVDMTPEKEEKVTRLVQLIKEECNPLPLQLQILLRYSPTPEDAPTPHNTTRSYAYYALISREWNVQKALDLIKQNAAYRKEFLLDERSELPSAISIRGWDQVGVTHALGKEPRAGHQRLDQIVSNIERYFPCGIHFWDRYGQPVVYLMLGSVDEENLLKTLKQTANIRQSTDAVLWEMLQHMVGSGEWLVYYQQMQYDAGVLKVDATEGLIRATTIVVDLKGFTYKMIWKPAIDLLMNSIKELLSHYPECVHQICVVNAPSMVSFAYNIIKKVLPQTVQAKICMAGSSESLALLKEYIEEQYVPDFYGGACHCQGGCVRSFSPKNGTADTAATAKGGDSARHGHDEVPMEGDVITEDITLRAGARHTKVFHLRAKESVVWDFVSSKGRDMAFSTYFIPQPQVQYVDVEKADARSLSPYIVSKTTPSEGAGEYSAVVDGVMMLMWDNKQSWLTTKRLQMKVFKQHTHSHAKSPISE